MTAGKILEKNIFWIYSDFFQNIFSQKWLILHDFGNIKRKKYL